MLIVRSTCSCAPACGGDKARETGRSALVADEGAVIRLTTKSRALTQVNRFRPRYTMAFGQPAGSAEACHCRGSNERRHPTRRPGWLGECATTGHARYPGSRSAASFRRSGRTGNAGKPQPAHTAAAAFGQAHCSGEAGQLPWSKGAWPALRSHSKRGFRLSRICSPTDEPAGMVRGTRNAAETRSFALGTGLQGQAGTPQQNTDRKDRHGWLHSRNALHRGRRKSRALEICMHSSTRTPGNPRSYSTG